MNDEGSEVMGGGGRIPVAARREVFGGNPLLP